MKRLVILDPGLITVLSHHYSEANALLREAHALHMPSRVICHRDASARVRQIPAEPFFRHHGYGHLADARPATDFMAIHFGNQSTLADLETLTPTLTAGDVVLFPTVTCNLVMAICRWMAGFPPQDAPRFILCLMFPPDVNAEARPSPVALDTYRQAFARIAPALVRRVVFTCEIDALSDGYEPLLGTRPVTLPIPTWATACDESSDDESSEKDELRISFLGGARTEKGFHLLPEVVDLIRQRYPAARFLVQAAGHEVALIESVTRDLEAHQDVVTLVRHPLSDDELRAAMKGSRLLLLPYDRDRYRTRGSSLFAEARRTGVPMVVPAGTVFGDEGRRSGIATTFDAFTAAGVADAAIRTIERIDQLSSAARLEACSEHVNGTGYLAVLLERFGYVS